jgi:hypothetical protein
MDQQPVEQTGTKTADGSSLYSIGLGLIAIVLFAIAGYIIYTRLSDKSSGGSGANNSDDEGTSAPVPKIAPGHDPGIKLERKIPAGGGPGADPIPKTKDNTK